MRVVREFRGKREFTICLGKHVELLPTFSGSSTAFVAGEGSGRLDQQLTSVPKYPCIHPLPQPRYEAIPKVYKVICFTDTYNLALTAVFFKTIFTDWLFSAVHRFKPDLQQIV